jgi:hypothetical protein
MTREEMLDQCICPICEEAYASYSDLYECLLEHLDEGIDIAEDYLEEASRLAAEEEFEGDEDE